MEVHAGPSAPVRGFESSSILAVCPEPHCGQLTMGGTCVRHDPLEVPVYPRGRPFERTDTRAGGADV